LGRHSKPSRIRVPQAAVAAAVPTVAGVAVTLCLSPQAAQAMPVSSGAPVVALTAAAHSGPADATTSADRAAAATRRRLPSSYTVQPGDSLSSIAKRLYHDEAAWTLLYWRNAREIRWANDIEAGQVLRVPAEPARLPAAPSALGPPAPAAAPSAATAAPQTAAGSAAASATYDGGVPGGAFGQCVIARESGGDAQIMNATGHYGLYQFSASTWAKYGGNPADFGDASVAEQNQVFANALAAGGESNWAPYDGC
jgi:LysM repeat protein